MLRQQRYAPSYTQATGSVEPYRGVDHTVAVMIQLARRQRNPLQMVGTALDGERSIRVRRHAEQIINNVRPKDYTSEVVAIGKWWGNAGRYTRDPVHVEMLGTTDRMIDDAARGSLLLDCDGYSTAIGASCLTIGAPVDFITVGFETPMWGQPPVYTHVFARAQDPRSKVWWVLDPVAGRRTASMLARVKVYKIFKVE
jgi:hypothetical protein